MKLEGKRSIKSDNFEKTNSFSCTDWLTMQAVTKQKEGKLAEAIAFYLEAIELDNNQPVWVYVDAATLLVEIDNLQQALDLSEKAQKIYQTSAEIEQVIKIICDQQNILQSKINQREHAAKINILQTKAVAKHKEGKLAEAIALYEDAIDLDNAQPTWVYGNLIILLSEFNRLDEGLKLGEKALQVYPESDEIYRGLGVLHDKKQKSEQSIFCLKQALKLGSRQPDWVYQIIVQNLLKLEQIAQANDFLQQGLDIYPNSDTLRLLMQESLQYKSKLESKQNQAPQTQKKSLNFLAFNKNKKAKENSSLQEKELSNSKNEVTEPTEPSESISELTEKADAFFDANEYEQALAKYQTLLNIDSENYHGLLRKGECLFRVGQYDNAEQCLKNLLNNHPNSFWPLVCLGETHFKQAKFESSIGCLEQAVSIQNNTVWPWILLGKSYKNLHEYDKAITCFQQTITLDLNQDIGYVNLAEVHTQLKQYQEAQSYWLKAIEINPKNKWSYISLGYSYLESKELDIAEDFFIKNENLFVNDYDFVFAFAHVYIAKMEWIKAEQIMKKASSLNPDFLEIKVRLLELSLYSGNLVQANEYFEYLQAKNSLPNSFFQAAAKMFSEKKDWDLAFEFAAKSIYKQPDNIHNHTLFIKTVRKSKKFRDALEILMNSKSVENQNKNNYLFLVAAIHEQLIKSIPIAKQLLPSLTENKTPGTNKIQLLEKRLLVKENIFHESIENNHQLETDIFYCTDLGYSLPTLVSIYSLYKKNKSKLQNKSIYVVAQQETLNVIAKIYENFAKQFNFCIQLIDICALVKDSIDYKLNTSYGVFTGGDSLSSTAYYRLFFSQFLEQYSKSSRWLYIDSDTLIIDSLEKIDEINFEGLPIAAKQERDKPEVQKTIEMNNLQHGKYFNSGVIAFNTKHPRLAELLNKAVDIAMNEGHKLLYHDQCALNIAFDGQIADLPSQFNDYYPPSDFRGIEELSFSSNSCILHLLDRPKPWDTLNYHTGSILWFNILEEMANIVPSNSLLELFQFLQNTV